MLFLIIGLGFVNCYEFDGKFGIGCVIWLPLNLNCVFQWLCVVDAYVDFLLDWKILCGMFGC